MEMPQNDLASSGASQNARDPQRQVKDGQMLVGAVDEPLVELGEDHDDLVLLLVGYGVVVHDLLVELCGVFCARLGLTVVSTPSH